MSGRQELEKSVRVTEVGNAYMLQLQVWTENDGLNDRGKPIAVLNTGGSVDKDLGAAVRKALATRVRRPKEEKAEAAE